MSENVPSGWAQTNHALTRTLQRADFTEALAFVLEIGKLAETANHHPDINIRYRNVHLSLSTHDTGHTLTAKDFALARQINNLNEDAIRLTREKLVAHFAV